MIQRNEKTLVQTSKVFPATTTSPQSDQRITQSNNKECCLVRAWQCLTQCFTPSSKQSKISQVVPANLDRSLQPPSHKRLWDTQNTSDTQQDSTQNLLTKTLDLNPLCAQRGTKQLQIQNFMQEPQLTQQLKIQPSQKNVQKKKQKELEQPEDLKQSFENQQYFEQAMQEFIAASQKNGEETTQNFIAEQKPIQQPTQQKIQPKQSIAFDQKKLYAMEMALLRDYLPHEIEPKKDHSGKLIIDSQYRTKRQSYLKEACTEEPQLSTEKRQEFLKDLYTYSQYGDGGFHYNEGLFKYLYALIIKKTTPDLQLGDRDKLIQQDKKQLFLDFIDLVITDENLNGGDLDYLKSKDWTDFVKKTDSQARYHGYQKEKQSVPLSQRTLQVNPETPINQDVYKLKQMQHQLWSLLMQLTPTKEELTSKSKHGTFSQFSINLTKLSHAKSVKTIHKSITQNPYIPDLIESFANARSEARKPENNKPISDKGKEVLVNNLTILVKNKANLNRANQALVEAIVHKKKENEVSDLEGWQKFYTRLYRLVSVTLATAERQAKEGKAHNTTTVHNGQASYNNLKCFEDCLALVDLLEPQKTIKK